MGRVCICILPDGSGVCIHFQVMSKPSAAQRQAKKAEKNVPGVINAPTPDARPLDDGNANMESLMVTLMAKIDEV